MRTRADLLVFVSLVSAHPVFAQGAGNPDRPVKPAAGGCPAISVGNPHGNYIVPGSLGDIRYKNGLTMDAFAPKGEPRPAAVIIHGSRGNKRGFVTRLHEHAIKAGYAWFAPDFTNEADVAEGLRFIRCPGRFNITDRLVLIGEGSGAQLALNLAASSAAAGVVTVGGNFARQDVRRRSPRFPCS
jgi:hypothetical protein